MSNVEKMSPLTSVLMTGLVLSTILITYVIFQEFGSIPGAAFTLVQLQLWGLAVSIGGTKLRVQSLGSLMTQLLGAVGSIGNARSH